MLYYWCYMGSFVVIVDFRFLRFRFLFIVIDIIIYFILLKYEVVIMLCLIDN